MKNSQKLANLVTDVDATLIDKEAKRVPLILSNESKVTRWDWENGTYDLTLLHGEENINLERAGIMKLFFQHDTHGATPPIGKLENIRLEEGQLKADALFDPEDEFAMQIFGKMERGFLESVSVGVSIIDGKMKQYKARRNQYTATKWELNEVSIVNVPAIPSAKIGLAQENTEKGKDMQLSDINVVFLKEHLPELIAEVETLGYEKGKTEGMTIGADNELARIKAISEISALGYESTLEEAKVDKDATVESTKLKLYDLMQETLSNAKRGRMTDGADLADQAKNIAGVALEGEDKKAGERLMAEAGKKAQGE